MIAQIPTIANEIINEGVGELFYMLPLPFIAAVVSISIWLGFTKIDGTTKKKYKLYNVISAVSIAALAHFTIPVGEAKVHDIPTLIISIVFSGVALEIFVYWRKKKNKIAAKNPR